MTAELHAIILFCAISAPGHQPPTNDQCIFGKDVNKAFEVPGTVTNPVMCWEHGSQVAALNSELIPAGYDFRVRCARSEPVEDFRIDR